MACKSGSLEVVKYLLSFPENDINAVDLILNSRINQIS